MKRVAIGAMIVMAVLYLTACGDSLEDIERDAKFKNACHEAGGRVYWAEGYRCNFEDEGQ